MQHGTRSWPLSFGFRGPDIRRYLDSSRVLDLGYQHIGCLKMDGSGAISSIATIRRFSGTFILWSVVQNIVSPTGLGIMFLYRKDATRHYSPGRECLMYPILNMSKRVSVASALWSRSGLFNQRS